MTLFLSLSLLHPHWPPCCSRNTSGLFVLLDFGTSSSFCLEYSFFYAWNILISMVFAHKSATQCGLFSYKLIPCTPSTFCPHFLFYCLFYKKFSSMNGEIIGFSSLLNLQWPKQYVAYILDLHVWMNDFINKSKTLLSGSSRNNFMPHSEQIACLLFS